MFYSDKFAKMTHIEKIKIRYQRLINNCDTALRDCQDLDMKEFWLKTKLLVTEKYQKLCSLD